eukprot:GHVS01105067.1.p1 GENE.GHVS01105067.1~~GHVS01105067.1.p1  ORF type:complete len:599 (+),score=54.24 GHVS01105067.1:182-1978(+)
MEPLPEGVTFAGKETVSSPIEVFHHSPSLVAGLTEPQPVSIKLEERPLPVAEAEASKTLQQKRDADSALNNTAASDVYPPKRFASDVTSTNGVGCSSLVSCSESQPSFSSSTSRPGAVWIRGLVAEGRLAPRGSPCGPLPDPPPMVLAKSNSPLSKTLPMQNIELSRLSVPPDYHTNHMQRLLPPMVTRQPCKAPLSVANRRGRATVSRRKNPVRNPPPPKNSSVSAVGTIYSGGSVTLPSDGSQRTPTANPVVSGAHQAEHNRKQLCVKASMESERRQQFSKKTCPDSVGRQLCVKAIPQQRKHLGLPGRRTSPKSALLGKSEKDSDACSSDLPVAVAERSIDSDNNSVSYTCDSISVASSSTSNQNKGNASRESCSIPRASASAVLNTLGSDCRVDIDALAAGERTAPCPYVEAGAKEDSPDKAQGSPSQSPPIIPSFRFTTKAAAPLEHPDKERHEPVGARVASGCYYNRFVACIQGAWDVVNRMGQYSSTKLKTEGPTDIAELANVITNTEKLVHEFFVMCQLDVIKAKDEVIELHRELRESEKSKARQLAEVHKRLQDEISRKNGKQRYDDRHPQRLHPTCTLPERSLSADSQ